MIGHEVFLDLKNTGVLERNPSVHVCVVQTLRPCCLECVGWWGYCTFDVGNVITHPVGGQRGQL